MAVAAAHGDAADLDQILPHRVVNGWAGEALTLTSAAVLSAQRDVGRAESFSSAVPDRHHGAVFERRCPAQGRASRNPPRADLSFTPARLLSSAFPLQSLDANPRFSGEIWGRLVIQLDAVDALLLAREI